MSSVSRHLVVCFLSIHLHVESFWAKLQTSYRSFNQLLMGMNIMVILSYICTAYVFNVFIGPTINLYNPTNILFNSI